MCEVVTSVVCECECEFESEFRRMLFSFEDARVLLRLDLEDESNFTSVFFSPSASAFSS